MIGIDVLIAEIEGLNRQDLQRWIDNDWVRPGRDASGYFFYEIDVERIRLIQQLCHGMQINEDALPVVLLLLDQIYDLRRCMRALSKAIQHTTTGETRQRLAQHLTSGIDE
jgi:chaperone modulatory protein CbpM